MSGTGKKNGSRVSLMHFLLSSFIVREWKRADVLSFLLHFLFPTPSFPPSYRSRTGLLQALVLGHPTWLAASLLASTLWYVLEELFMSFSSLLQYLNVPLLPYSHSVASAPTRSLPLYTPLSPASSLQQRLTTFFFSPLPTLQPPKGEHYRSVIQTPKGSDHGNIRNLLSKGWRAVSFPEGLSLRLKK